MSGPKSGSYSVSNEAYRRERERREAEAVLWRVQEQVAEFEAHVHDALRRDADLQTMRLPDRPAAPDPSETADEMRATADKLGRYLELLRESFEEQQTAARTARVLRAIDGSRTHGRRARTASEALRGRKAPAERTTPSAPDQWQPIRDSVTRILGRIDVDVPGNIRASLEELGRSAMESSNASRAETIVLELRQRAVDANARAARRASDRRQAFELLASLDAAGIASETLNASLQAVVHTGRELDDHLVRDVRRKVEAAHLQADRSFVTSQLEVVLADLGYELQDGFETALVRDGIAHFQHVSWSEYAARVRLSPNSRRMTMHMVRPQGPDTRDQRLRDEEMEHSFCGQVPDLLAACATHGVDIDLDRRTAPGERPVPEVEHTGLSTASRRNRRSHARPQQERRRD